ncbi:MAG TPA: ABC transporter permease [Gemmatimonadales bacterium]|nr:ABC transporter permease [Gemmatimonadales bacterium]
MPIYEAITLALGTIRAQKLKSFFSLVGAFIGVMFLIAVVSIVKGMDKYVQEDFAAKIFGINTFTVTRRPGFQAGPVSESQRRAWRRRPQLYEDDFHAVRAALPPEFMVAIESDNQAEGVVGTKHSAYIQVSGVSEELFKIRDYRIAEGRLFTPQEISHSANVVVIGKDVADSFFTGLDPLGRSIRIAGFPYTVIGVIEKQGKVFGFSLDRFAIAPYTSEMKKIVNPHKVVDGIIVKSPTAAAMQDAMDRVEGVMRSRHHLRPEDEDDFHLDTQEDVLSFWAKISKVLYTALPMLVGISLLVGGIVLMNIMLMAVAERTREIGIRKSLGARRRDIMAQFLVEAATLSTTGAVLGIVAGLLLARLVQAVSPLPMGVSVPWLVVGVVLGVGVGIVSGVYPASRAARLDPVAALRFE